MRYLTCRLSAGDKDRSRQGYCWCHIQFFVKVLLCHYSLLLIMLAQTQDSVFSFLLSKLVIYLNRECFHATYTTNSILLSAISDHAPVKRLPMFSEQNEEWLMLAYSHIYSQLKRWLINTSQLIPVNSKLIL